MKMIHCDLCGTDVVLTKETKVCNCGNIAGNYQENNTHADIYLRNEKSFMTSRVIGVSNSVMTGYNKRDIAHVGEWNDYQLHIYVDGVKREYEDVKFPIIPWEENAEIMAEIMELNGYTPDDIAYSMTTETGTEYKMKDGGKVGIVPERKDVKEPMVYCIRIENEFLIETKLCKFVMR
jgi:hypothetical protein